MQRSVKNVFATIKDSFFFLMFVFSFNLVLDGSLTTGSLTLDDKTQPYGTAATSEFKPYISDPAVTGSMTSRSLRNRYSVFFSLSLALSLGKCSGI